MHALRALALSLVMALATGGAAWAQGAEATHVAFVVRFRGEGPIARAQALAARGQVEPASARVRRELTRQVAFRGLCFDRFTLGAAEIVLRSCAPVGPRERAAVERRWLARLNAMGSVEYADLNAVGAPARRPS